jgi:hypothetical protein
MLIRAKNEEGVKHRNTSGARHHATVFQAQPETTSQRRWPFGPTSGPVGPGGGRPLSPPYALVFLWRWHGGMQRRFPWCFVPKIGRSTAFDLL